MLPQAIAGAALPQRDHGGEVERRDAGDDAERLAHRIEVDARAGALGVFALHQVRDAAGELDHFEPALDVALGVGEGLAVLGGEQPGEIVVLGLDQLEEVEHHPRAALRVGGRPAGKRGLRVRDRLFDLGLAGECDLGLHLAGVRIEYVASPA